MPRPRKLQYQRNVIDINRWAGSPKIATDPTKSFVPIFGTDQREEVVSNKTKRAEQRAANATKVPDVEGDTRRGSFNGAQAASIAIPAAYSLMNFLNQKRGGFNPKFDPVNLSQRVVSRPLMPRFARSTRAQGSSLTDRDFVSAYNRSMDEVRRQQFEQNADASVNAQLDRNNDIRNQEAMINTQKADRQEQFRAMNRNAQQERIESAANVGLQGVVNNLMEAYNQRAQRQALVAPYLVQYRLRNGEDANAIMEEYGMTPKKKK